MSSQEIVNAALSLSEQDRLSLVETLLESLHPDGERVDDEEFTAELLRRKADFEQGTADGVPWSQLCDEE